MLILLKALNVTCEKWGFAQNYEHSETRKTKCQVILPLNPQMQMFCQLVLITPFELSLSLSPALRESLKL